jgi:hypothetical protein
MDPRAVDLLRRAQHLVCDGWSQHADARAADGSVVQPWQDTAVAWSLLGALVAALEEQVDHGGELPLDGLAAALHELANVVDDDSLAGWNDEPSRTQAGVAAVLSAAANAAAGKLADGQDNSLD